jgi:hypothetical protein
VELSAHGIACFLGGGWSGYIFKPDDPSDETHGPCLHATTGTLPATPQSSFGFGVAKTLTTSQVHFALVEFYADDIVVPGQGLFAASVTIPPTLVLSDFDANTPLADDPVSTTLVGAQKFCTLYGRPFAVFAVLGAPTQALVDQVNGTLSTVQVDPIGDRYRRTVLETDGLVAYWRLADTSGTVAADEKGANPGSYLGPSTRGTTGLVVKSTDPSVQFPGTSGTGGTVKVLDKASLQTPNAFTVEAWIKLTTLAVTGGRQVVARKFGVWMLSVTSTGQLELQMTTGAGATVTVTSAAGVIVAGQIHHVAAAMGGPTVGANSARMCQLYVDGNNVAAGSVATPLGTLGDLYLAGYTAATPNIAYLTGTLDEVAVYSQAISQETLQAHFRTGSEKADNPDEYSGMIYGAAAIQSWWRMNETQGSICQDYAGAAHATIVGPWATAAPLTVNSADRGMSLTGGWLNCGAGPETQLPSASFAVEAWIRVAQMPSTGNCYVLSKQDAYELWVSSVGVVGFDVAQPDQVGITRVQSGTGKIVAGSTYHVVASCDGNLIHLYVNDTEVGAVSSVNTWPQSGSPLYIGGRGSLYLFRGVVDEVVLYGDGLARATIGDHKRIGTGGSLDDPAPSPPNPPPPQDVDDASDVAPYHDGTGVELTPDEA